MELSRRTLRELRALTQQNAHTEAYLLGARTLGLTDLVATLDFINRECERAGELLQSLSEPRYKAYSQMLAEARKLLTEEQYNQFYRCF